MARPLYLWALLALLPLSIGAATPPDDTDASGAKPAAGATGTTGTSDTSAKSVQNYRQDLLKNNDPKAADAFLKDRAYQEQLKRDDPELFDKLFAAATQAKEMQDILTLQKGHVSGLREALASRSKMPLAQDPKALQEWALKNLPDLDMKALDKALWGWNGLTDEQTAFLADRGIGSAKWATMSFPDRQAAMGEWSKGVYDEFMGITPKGPEDVSRMRALQLKGSEAFSYDQGVEISRRLDQANAAVGAIAQAEQVLAGASNPALRAQLDRAKSSGSVGDMLTSLGQFFDRAKVAPPAALVAEAPVSAAQTMTKADKQVIAQELAEGFRQQLKGTTGGDRVLAFYADPKHPMNIAIEDAGAAMAFAQGGKVTFGQRTVERFLKTYEVKGPDGKTVKTGITVDELKKDPQAMKSLVWEMSPCFVHESTHLMQDAWAKDNKIPPWYVQRQETETMSMQALFVLEKSKSNPAYAAYLKQREPNSERVQLDLGRARNLELDPVEFRNGIRRVYRDTDSPESAAWSDLNSNREYMGSAAAGARAQRGYYAFVDRSDGVDRLVEQRLKALQQPESAPAPAPSRVSGTLAVPVPKPAAAPRAAPALPRPIVPERSDE